MRSSRHTFGIMVIASFVLWCLCTFATAAKDNRLKNPYAAVKKNVARQPGGARRVTIRVPPGESDAALQARANAAVKQAIENGFKVATARGVFEFERELEPSEIVSTDNVVCFMLEDTEHHEPFFSAAPTDLYPENIHHRLFLSAKNILTLVPQAGNDFGQWDTWYGSQPPHCTFFVRPA